MGTILVPITRRQFVAYAAAGSVALRPHRLAALAVTQQSPEAPAPPAAPPDAAAVRKLASQTAGRVITPDSPDYESSRLVFNRAFDKRPALIVRCARDEDIARALEFAQRHALTVAVRGGGHNRAGLSVCDGGVLIDLAAMNQIVVNADTRVARAQAGALTVHVDTATQHHGLATTLAGCPTVGIAGLTLGGGEGLLMSKYGLACDNLASARLLTVDGRQVEASLTSNPDLFWAIRGGGGNFGVALALEYRLHPVSDVLAGTLVYSVGAIQHRLEIFAQVVASAPDELNVVGIVSASTQGPRFQMIVAHCGDPQHGNALLSPLRALNPQEDTVRTMSYLQANATINPAAPVAHFQTDLFVPQLTAGVIATIASAIEAAPPGSRVFMVPIYGAVTRVGITDTAFPLRHPGCELDIMGRWQDPSDKDAAVQWVKALRDKLHPFATGAYVNQLGETSADLVRTAYGANYSRLAALKKKYDPNNVLRSNQNVRPS
jgi:FAD/FMN-containing dehydrogenase